MEFKNDKKIGAKEFRMGGYLQELNRRFLHPLGLALEVKIDKDTGKEIFGDVWDAREDPEGFIYSFATRDNNDISIEKKEKIDKEFDKKSAVRKKILGFEIEPIERVKND